MRAANGEIAPLIWSKVIGRHWRREPKVPATLILLLALGVAVFLAVRLANRAAVTGFSLFTESISGDSDLIVRPEAGRFSEVELLSLREALGDSPAAMFPVLEATAAIDSAPDSPLLRIVGSDLVAISNAPYLQEGDFRSPFASLTDEFASVLSRPDRVFVAEDFPSPDPVKKGNTLTFYLGGKEKTVTVAGILENDPLRPRIPQNLVLLDLPGAQTLTGNAGTLSRIEVRVPPGPDFALHLAEARERLVAWGEGRFIVETPEQRRESATQMSAAFRLNLTILSTLALIVGAYLILQAMEASVIRRRYEISILRCLGVTPAQIRVIWLAESAVLGLLGSLTGIVLGVLLAQGMVRAIASTVNTLYFETTAGSASLHPAEAGLALGFGVVVSLTAGWLPAREASRVPPALGVATGSRGGGLKLLRMPWLGVVFTLLAAGLSLLPPLVTGAGHIIPLGGYLAALLFLAGLSILAGLLFRPLCRLLRLGDSSPLRTYAASQFRQPEGRHRLAAAGLLAAFGMSAAMGILVASFENTLTAWIRQLLKADVYIAAAGADSVSSGDRISEEVWRAIGSREGVDGLDRIRVYPVTISGQEAWLAGSHYNRSDRRLRLIWLNRPADTGADALEKAGDDDFPCWINEPFSRKFGANRGDRFPVPTPAGPRTVRVAGVYADYGSERGTVIVAQRFTREWFDDTSVNNLAVFLEPGVDAERWINAFREDHPGLVARTNRKLREDALALFRQTFRVTYALEAIAVVVAVAGLGLAMVGLLLDRKAELSTLRELGWSRRQIAAAAAWEGLGLSLVGALGGLVLALILGLLLVYVINRQSFGWTLDLAVPWLSFAGLVAALLATGAVVSWFVGNRIANLRSDDVLEPRPTED